MSKPNPRVVKLTDLVPDSRNANKGTLRGLAMLDDSLREDGAGRGILLDRNNQVVAGNKTLERAVDLGFTEVIIVPTDGKQLVATQRVDVDLDSPQGRRMGLRDNRVGQVDLDFDPDVLKSLQDEGLDLSKLWNEDELAALLASVGGDEPPGDPGAQTDRAAELQEKWQVARGDVWQIGRHRLLCGDSTSAEDVARVCAGKVDMVFTDPPYNTGREQGRTQTNWGVIENDDQLPEHFATWLIQVNDTLSAVAKNCPWYICCNWRSLPSMLVAFGEMNSCIVWAKNVFGLGEGYRPQHEFILFRGRIEANDQSDLWQVDKDALSTYQHPMQKPVELVSRAINNSSKRGSAVLDLFLGSGTTLVACEQTGRVGRGIEISEKYCAVILERLAGMGLTPERVA